MPTPRPPVSKTPPSTPLTTVQRTRVRKLIRRSLLGLVGIQILALGVIATPQASATGWPVFDLSNILQALVEWGESQLRNEVLSRTEAVTGRVRDIAEQNLQGIGVYGGNANTFNANDVSTTVVEDAFGRHEITGGGEQSMLGNQQPIDHLGYTSAASVQSMERLMPGVKAWDNYQEDYLASADGALTTMRASMDALNQFHQHMAQDDGRFTSLLNKANGIDSELAIGQLQVESQLEVARQLQALRAQQALQTNIYAVTESHRVSAEARSMAKAKRNGCQMLAMFGGGLMGGIAGETAGTLFSQGCN